MEIDRNLIGDRGQQFAHLALTESIGTVQSLFRPCFLGDKHATFDFIVYLEQATLELTPFFFVQVKATQLGFNRSGNLRVYVTHETIANLVAYPVPTYIIGVDVSGGGASFIVAALNGGPSHYPSLPTTHRLNEQTLRDLYDEVRSYWQTHAAAFKTSRFG